MSDDLEVIQVIKTRLLRRGQGHSGDPIRIIEQYWDMEGNALWERDTLTGKVHAPKLLVWPWSEIVDAN